MLHAAMPRTRSGPAGGAEELVTELARRGIPAHTHTRDGRACVRVEVDGAPSAGFDVEHTAGQWVSEWGNGIGAAAPEVADYACWLLGVRP